MSVQLSIHKPIAILTLKRPEVYNAINREMLHSLRSHLEHLNMDHDIRVVVITGAGEKAFCSGADLKERSTMSDDEVRAYLHLIGDTFSQLEDFSKPTIAAINGIALGGGTELALACDLRLISENGVMGLTETTLGIIPGAGGTQRLPRLIGRAAAKELIFTGRKVHATEAKEMGLVNRVVPFRDFIPEVLAVANTIAENAPLALKQAKWAIHRGVETNMKTGLAIEAEAYQRLIKSKDRLEGLNAFREKRKPRYIGE